MDIFVSCFWGTDIERQEIAQSFFDRYPNVVLLTTVDSAMINCKHKEVFDVQEKGQIQYILINKFIKSKDISTLTIIDSDIILGPDFFQKIIDKHKVSYNGLITIRKSYQGFNNAIAYPIESMIFSKAQGHTGYILSFKKFVLDIGLSESFLHGGYDFLLTKSALNRNDLRFSSSFLQKEFKKFNTIGADYIDCDIIHIWHKPRGNQNTPWEKYV